MKIKDLVKDRFVIVCMVVGMGLVLFFFLGVCNLWSQIAKIRNELAQEVENLDKALKDMEKGIGTQSSKELMEKYQAYYQKLEIDYKASLEYYKKADSNLERWFNGLVLEPDMLPSGGAFYTNYGAERDALMKLLKNKKIAIGKPGANVIEEEVIGFGEPKPEDRSEFRELQKRFWIQERIIKTIVNSNVTRCEAINFTGKRSSLTTVAGEIIPVELIVYLHYQDIPQFIHQLMDVSQGGFFIVIKRLNITRVAEQLEEYPEIKYPLSQPMISERGKWQPPQIPAPLVKLSLLCGVLDFDIKDK